MELLEGMITRQSIRAYDLEHGIQEEEITAIMRAGMNAPSALGQHAWRFVTITEHSTLMKIAALKDWWSMLNEASLGIGIVIDPAAADGLDEEFLVISAAMAAENMLLAAHAKGFGGVYLGVSNKEDYYPAFVSLMNIPEPLRLIGVVSVGYPKEKPAAPADRFEEKKWIREHF